jgi:oligosaccharide repeat unit polymerase
MFAVAIIFILSTHCIPWLIETGTGSVFTPAKISSLVSLITTVPFLIIIGIDPETSAVYSYLGAPEFDVWVLKFSALYSLGFLAYFLGVYIRCPRLVVRFFRTFQANVQPNRTALIVFILAVIGSVACYQRIQYAGGIAFLLQNAAQRSAILAGSGALAFTMDAAIFSAMVLYTYSFRYRTSLLKKIGLVVIFISFAAMLSVFGGRKTTLYLLIFTLMTWSLCVAKIRHPLRLAVPLGIFVSFYFVAVLLLRDPVSGADYFDNLELLLSNVLDSADDLFINLSYVDTYLFVLKYFSENPHWFGAPFMDLVRLLIPGLYGGGRLPIDDGVYVRSLFDGFLVFPPTPAENMYPSSWPPDSFGGGYLNFGILGILSYMFLRGVVVNGAYKALKETENNPNLLYIYGFFILNFHLTNLRLVQCAMTLVGAVFVALIYRLVKK